MDKEISLLRADNNLIRTEIKNLDTKLSTEIKNLDNKFSSEIKNLESNLNTKIEKTINSNMRWSIGLIALIVTVLKVIDMIIMAK